MADKLTENDDDVELVAVETPPEDPPKPEDAETPAEDATSDDDDDQEDARLADDHSEDGDDADVAEDKRRKRIERRERQKRARENAERELEFLRGRVGEFEQRFRAIEGHTLTTQEQDLQRQYQAKLQEIQTAELVMARAMEAGNGDDHMLAERIRDEARYAAQQIAQQGQQIAQQREQVTNPGPDPRMLNHAQEWLSANSWYDPSGGDEDSAITRAIDIAMTREGHDPTSRAYWEELTRRVSARIGGGTEEPANDRGGRRKPPPQGTSRGEHAPVSTRKEIYVTPERKQAMIDAGYWDDPVKRNQMLKEYQQFDKSDAARS